MSNPKRRSYLDHNATTPLRPEARAAMAASMDVFGNPSSVHAEGRAARAFVDQGRAAVAALVGSAPQDVVFTSGATEALNIALTPALTRDGRRAERLLIAGGEHPAVRQGHRFGDRTDVVPSKRDGTIDLDALERRIGGEPVMLALQAANNETGVVQPVRAASDLVHAAGGYVVCDAVQAVGKIGCRLNDLGADVLAISAHKFGGPKGVGALCFGRGNYHLERGVVRGGGQERGLRSGTENLLGIVGMGAACVSAEAAQLSGHGEWRSWRAAIETAIRTVAPTAVVFGAEADRLPNTVCFAVPGYDSQVLLMSLDLSGVAVSAGSACAAGTVKPSPVLEAMGVSPELATRAVRVSLGWTTTADDIDAFATAFARAMTTMRPRAAA